MQFTMKQACAITGISQDTIRYYEETGLIQIRRKPNGYRYFEEDDLRVLQFIRINRGQGHSIEAIRQYHSIGSLDEFAVVNYERLQQLKLERLKNERQINMLQRYEEAVEDYRQNRLFLRERPSFHFLTNYRNGYHMNGYVERYSELSRLIPISGYLIRIPYESICSGTVINEYGIGIREDDAADLNVDTEGMVKIAGCQCVSVIFWKNRNTVTDHRVLKPLTDRIEKEGYQLCGDIVIDILCLENDSFCMCAQLPVRSSESFV